MSSTVQTKLSLCQYTVNNKQHGYTKVINTEMFRNDEKVRYFLCCYHNTSDEAVVLRIARIGGAALEQRISPREQLLFSAADSETAEIYTVKSGTESLLKALSCAQLRHASDDSH